MKTLIITLAISVFSWMNSDVEAKKFYKNVEIDKVENTITTTVCEGEKEMNLVPHSKHILKLNEKGEAMEKIIYTWNADNYQWRETHKYEYFCNSSGEIEYLTYAGWDESLGMWDTDVQYTMYIYSTEGDLLTVNQ